MTDDEMGIIDRTVFDYYIRVVKAIRPDGCSSVRAVLMAVAALQHYYYTRPTEIGRHAYRGPGAAPAYEQFDRVTKFFFDNFLKSYFSEKYQTDPHFERHRVVIDDDGRVSFELKTQFDKTCWAFLREIRISAESISRKAPDRSPEIIRSKTILLIIHSFA